MNRSTITTVTGKHVDPLHPAAQDLDMLDIAHALSLLCRGGGQTKTFYSVAQHSMACAEEANLRGHTSPVILGRVRSKGSCRNICRRKRRCRTRFFGGSSAGR